MRAAVGWLVGLVVLTGCGAHSGGSPEPDTVSDSSSPSDSGALSDSASPSDSAARPTVPARPTAPPALSRCSREPARRCPQPSACRRPGWPPARRPTSPLPCAADPAGPRTPVTCWCSPTPARSPVRCPATRVWRSWTARTGRSSRPPAPRAVTWVGCATRNRRSPRSGCRPADRPRRCWRACCSTRGPATAARSSGRAQHAAEHHRPDQGGRGDPDLRPGADPSDGAGQQRQPALTSRRADSRPPRAPVASAR